jgi:hypothetical protein
MQDRAGLIYQPAARDYLPAYCSAGQFFADYARTAADACALCPSEYSTVHVISRFRRIFSFRANQTLGVSSAIRLIGEFAKPGKIEQRSEVEPDISTVSGSSTTIDKVGDAKQRAASEVFAALEPREFLEVQALLSVGGCDRPGHCAQNPPSRFRADSDNEAHAIIRISAFSFSARYAK